MTCSAGFQPAAPTTLVVGLGNPILGDDGIGWRVAEALEARLDDPDVAVICLSVGGLALMEHLAGYRRALVIDAINQGAPAGTLHWLTPGDIAATGSLYTTSVHDLSFPAALALGRELGLGLPEDIAVLGVEAGPKFVFGETLSPAVAAAIPAATDRAAIWAGARVTKGVSVDLSFHSSIPDSSSARTASCCTVPATGAVRCEWPPRLSALIHPTQSRG